MVWRKYYFPHPLCQTLGQKNATCKPGLNSANADLGLIWKIDYFIEKPSQNSNLGCARLQSEF
tara:strand:- start:1083 stop:1271 length:189 start_codon:yes stop_codon:yes gene_type:complete